MSKKRPTIDKRYADAAALLREFADGDAAFVYVANGSSGSGYSLDRGAMADPQKRRKLAKSLALIALTLALDADIEMGVASPSDKPPPPDETPNAHLCPTCGSGIAEPAVEMNANDLAICYGCGTPLVVVAIDGGLGFRRAKPDEMPPGFARHVEEIARKRGQA